MFIIYEKWNSDGKTGPKSLIPPGFNHFLWHMLWGHAGSIHLWNIWSLKWMIMDENEWKCISVANFFPAFMYIFRKSSKQTPQIVLLLWGVDDKEDGKESKFGQILLEVGWNFCPLYGGAIVPLGCVPKVFSSDDNSLSWLWMGRLYGWDPEKISRRKIAHQPWIPLY